MFRSFFAYNPNLKSDQNTTPTELYGSCGYFWVYYKIGLRINLKQLTFNEAHVGILPHHVVAT